MLPCGAPKDEEEGLCGALLPHPLDSTSSTRGIRCGGAYLLPRAYRDIGSLYPVQTVCPHFDISFGCFVFGSVSFAFQSGCWAWDVRFSLLGKGLFVPAATWGFAMVYRWNYRCREWVVNTADDGEGKQNLVVPSPIWYGILPQHRKLYPALSPRRRRMTEFSKLNSVSTLANDLLRERTEPHWCAIGLAQTPPIPIPHIKVLRSAMNPWIHWFKSDRSPVPLNYIPQSLPVEGGWLRPAARERFS